MPTQLGVLAWGAWLVLMVFGLVSAMAREAHAGYASVRLPRLFFFLWILLCVLVFLSLRYTTEALLAAAAAVIVGIATFSISSGSADRRRELQERLEGARRALAEDPNNSMSEELLGDLYSTLEDEALARKHWARALELRSDAKLREKLAALDRRPPVFHLWGAPAAHEWRACPGCGGISARLAARCACGFAFFTEPGSWHAASLDRFCEESGVDALLKLALFLLPVLAVLGPLPYAAAWFLWSAAVRRPERPRPVSGAWPRLRARAALGLLLVAGAATAARVQPGLLKPRRAAPAAFLPAAAMPGPAGAASPAGVAASLDALLKQAGPGLIDADTRRLLEAELAKAAAAAGGKPRPAAPAVTVVTAEAEPQAPGFLGELRRLAGRARAKGGERSDAVKTVVLAVESLNHEERGRRLYGARLLHDPAVAGHPLAQSARAELERARASRDAELAEAAGAALSLLDRAQAERESGGGR